MPCNPLLYPNDFPSAIGGGLNAVDVAISDLQQQAEAAALRQVQSRRFAGRVGAINQNEDLPVINAPMPQEVVVGGKASSAIGSKGFWISGANVAGASLASMDQISYSNEAVSAFSIGLATPKFAASSACSTNAAYLAAGLVSTGRLSSIDKLILSTEVVAPIAATLQSSKWLPAGLSSPVSAFFGGGGWFEFASTNRTIDKVAFSNDGRTTLAAQLATSRHAPFGLASRTLGYVLGGTLSAGIFLQNSIERIAFSNDGLSTISALLAVATCAGSSLLTPTAGYLVGGLIVGGVISSIQRFTFSLEAVVSLGISLVQPNHIAAGVQSFTQGYVGGGSASWDYSATTSLITRVSFSGEALTPIGSTLSTPRYSPTGASNYTPSAGS